MLGEQWHPMQVTVSDDQEQPATDISKEAMEAMEATVQRVG